MIIIIINQSLFPPMFSCCCCLEVLCAYIQDFGNHDENDV